MPWADSLLPFQGAGGTTQDNHKKIAAALKRKVEVSLHTMLMTAVPASGLVLLLARESVCLLETVSFSGEFVNLADGAVHAAHLP